MPHVCALQGLAKLRDDGPKQKEEVKQLLMDLQMQANKVSNAMVQKVENRELVDFILKKDLKST